MNALLHCRHEKSQTGRSTILPRLPRQYLDLAVDTCDDLELALKGTAFVAGDNVIVAFGEHDAREYAGRFLDHVTAGRDHRPVRAGDRLAAAFADELERDQRGAVIDRHVGKLASLHPDVGTYHRVGVAII